MLEMREEGRSRRSWRALVQGLVLLLWELVLLVAKEPEQKNQKNRGGFFDQKTKRTGS